MASHGPFGHLQNKLWQKDGPFGHSQNKLWQKEGMGDKLAV